jgi:hypothetical protein
MATMVEPLATFAGAADIALAISCLSVGAFFPPAAWTFIVNKKDDANIIKLHTTLFSSCIGVSSKSGWLLSICHPGQINGVCTFCFFPLFSLFLHVQILINFGKMQGPRKKPDAV